MSGRVFVDTNVFVYLFDRDAPTKRSRAQTLLTEAHAAGDLVLSTQVLQEFFVTVTGKLDPPVPEAVAVAAVQAMSTLTVVQVDVAMILRAIQLRQEHQLSFWDALIVQAALDADCVTLLTEDLPHGRTIRDMRLENPFERV